MTATLRHLCVTTLVTFLVCACALVAVPLSAAPASKKKPESSPTVVISQIYTAGGITGATWRNDYVELFNRGDTPVNLAGWSLQYASSTGTSWNTTALAGSMPAGGYYLVQEGSGGSAGSIVSGADAIANINLGTTAGKVALVSGTMALNGICPVSASIVDFVGYGTTANCFEGGGRAPAPSTTAALLRAANGCTDTDNNNSDFSLLTANPRNSTSATNPCTTASPTPSSTASNTVIPPTDTFTPTTTETPTNMATATATPSETWTMTPVPPSAIPTETPSLTATTPTLYVETETALASSTPGLTLTETFTPSFTPSPTATATFTAAPTEVPTNTATGTATPTPTETITPGSTFTDTPPSHLVISQIYGGGGFSGATYQNDFIEIFNPGAVGVNLEGWSVQYASAVGTSWFVTALPDVTLVPGQYFLVKAAGGANGAALPEADAIGTIPLSTTAGKVALVYKNTALNGACPTDPEIVDFIGYGVSTNCFETAPTGASLSISSAAQRKNGGCLDSGKNATDFSLALPSPKNSESAFYYCQATATPTDTPTQTLTLTQTPTLTPTRTATLFALGIVINEFLPKPATDWNLDHIADSDDEWIELYNPNSFEVDVSGWWLDDVEDGGSDAYFIPPGTMIEANGFLLFFRADTDIALNDTGDQVRLLFPDTRVADKFTFTETGGDQSYARLADGSGVFEIACVPSPGRANCTEQSAPTPTATVIETPAGTPTATITATPVEPHTPTPVPSALDVVIDEVAWSGTQTSADDEWIELYNNQAFARDLNGWTLDDGGDIDITLTGVIPARGFYLLERTDDATVSDIAADQIYTGGLNNNGETLTLRDAAGNVIDTANGDGGAWAAGSVAPACSMERIEGDEPESATNWRTNSNRTRNGVDAGGNSICGTPKNENSKLSPTLTPTSTGTPAPDSLFVNEFLADPARDWNEDGVSDESDEWIEIYNANSFAVNLSGWLLDDVADGGSAPYVISDGTMIAAHGFLSFSRLVTHVALNNANDDVRLLKPDGVEADMISYKTSDKDTSWSRVPDGARFFGKECPPTPSATNCSVLPTPTVTPTPFASKIRLNEILPAPYKDWNHDTLLDSADEWIEVYNAANKSTDLSGWYLDDGKDGSSAYRIPKGVTIAPHEYLIFYASQTQIGLNNSGDTVRLLYPDKRIADKMRYAPLETNMSIGRAPDESGNWRVGCMPTPGALNCSRVLAPTPTRVFELVTIADARALPAESRVSVLGSVIAHPCELDTYGREMTLSDGNAGIDVYMEFPNQLSCLIPRGEQMVVSGVLRDHLGMVTLYPDSNDDVTRHYAAPRSIVPKSVHTGDVDESVESMLVTIQGSVSNGKNGDTLWVNDGTGAVEVYADDDSHAFLGDIPRGSVVRMTGIGYQYNTKYYIRLRAPEDVIVLERAEKAESVPKGRSVDIGEVSIAQALETQTQNYVTVGGVVTVPPGVIAPRDFWIQDANGGVHVYFAGAAGAPPQLAPNTTVMLRGRVVSSFGAREIRIEAADALRVFGAGSEIAPIPLETGKADFANEGKLVVVNGFVSSAQGRQIYVDDGSGEVLVYIDANTKVRWGDLKRGDPARIIGVLTRFRGAPEILPRFQADVQFGAFVLPTAGKPDAGFLERMRVRGGVGEELRITNRVRARASGFAGLLTFSRREESRNVVSSGKDRVEALAYLLLVGSGVLGTIAVWQYRRGRRNAK